MPIATICCGSIPTAGRNRFAGAVSDEFVRDYAELSFGIDALIHGFFVDGTLRGAASCVRSARP